MDLAMMQCSADQDRISPLTRREIVELRNEIPEWEINEGRLFRRFARETFMDAVALLNEVAALAEHQGHYPDICIREYRYVEISLYTHPAGGLTVNDFIMAAKLTAMEFSRQIEGLSSTD
jgi:4a-hydroxytetrahydrobiopterin dehydratase